MVVVQTEQPALLDPVLEAVAQVALMAAIKMVVCMVVAAVVSLAVPEFVEVVLFVLFGQALHANSLQLM
jgi:hypothetical membrane protein